MLSWTYHARDYILGHADAEGDADVEDYPSQLLQVLQRLWHNDRQFDQASRSNLQQHFWDRLYYAFDSMGNATAGAIRDTRCL